MKKIQIAVGPLSNAIYAGHTLKAGTWAADKQDVTIDALVAVAEHVIKFGEPVTISDSMGNLEYKITVEKF